VCFLTVCVVYVTYSGDDDSSTGHAVSHHVHIAVVTASNVPCLGQHATDREERNWGGRERREGEVTEK
jgi:hypothetical protein